MIIFVFFGHSTCLAAADFDTSPGVESVWPKDVLGFSTAEPLSMESVRLQDKLVKLANHYSSLSYVPYIWGGGRIGSKSTCLACRRCVQEKKPAVKQRMQVCKPCQQCGIDCSHFVYKLYNEVGLDYSYASSWELSRQTPKGLLRHYNTVDIGTDLTLAQPGDLLVYRRHIVMLVRAVNDTHADFVHATRFRWGDKYRLGGFRWDKNENAKKFRGKLVRILRHSQFFKDPQQFIEMKQVFASPFRSYRLASLFGFNDRR